MGIAYKRNLDKIHTFLIIFILVLMLTYRESILELQKQIFTENFPVHFITLIIVLITSYALFHLKVLATS